MTTPAHSPSTASGTPPTADPPAPSTQIDPSRARQPKQDATNRPSRLSPSTVAGYAADWALFTDWACATDQLALPASPDAVLAFLQDCPAAKATQRRRVIAIDHHHTAAGQPAPGSTDVVRAALGRRVREWTADPAVADQVHRALLEIPSHGWTGGFFGRRDRLILTLTHLAGLTYRDQHHLRARDVQVTDGVLTVDGRTRTARLDPHPDPRLCPACTAIRWLNALHVVVTRPAISMLAGPLQRAPAVTGDSAHLCAGSHAAAARVADLPLLVPIDRYGGTALPLEPLAPAAIAQLARPAQSRAHPVLESSSSPKVSTDESSQVVEPGTMRPPPRHYSRHDRDAQLLKRADARTALSDVGDTLDQVDAALAELDERIKLVLGLS